MILHFEAPAENLVNENQFIPKYSVWMQKIFGMDSHKISLR